MTMRRTAHTLAEWNEQSRAAFARMSAADAARYVDLQADIALAYETARRIDMRYPGGLTLTVNAADFQEVKRLLAVVDAGEDALVALEDAYIVEPP